MISIKIRSLLILVAAAGLMLAAPQPSQAQNFFQGFETDTSGWFNSGGTVNREPSGYSTSYADGINSAAGNYDARLALDTATTCDPGSASCDGPYTLWGASGFGVPMPRDGSVTSIDIYLDVDFAASHPDYRFDWDSALNDSNGELLQDYVFNAGTGNPLDPWNCTGLSSNTYFVISASNSSQRNGAYPQNPEKNPQCISASGWYTFQHVFRPDSTGGLEVDMSIIDSTGMVVASWVQHPTCMGAQASNGLCAFGDPLPFSAVGYNVYGSLRDQEIDQLAIDNSSLVGFSKDGCKNGGWQVLGFKNQGQCVASVVSQSSNY